MKPDFQFQRQPDDHDFRDNHFGYCRECGRPAAVHLQPAGVQR